MNFISFQIEPYRFTGIFKTTMAYRFFKIKGQHEDNKGKRFFKVSDNNEKVIQVCLFAGKVKRGISCTYGITLIGRTTFFANYRDFYVEECNDGNEFILAFNVCVEHLKTTFSI